MATHSSIRAWEISWTEGPGGLQTTGSQRVRHDLAIKTTTNMYTRTYFNVKKKSGVFPDG